MITDKEIEAAIGTFSECESRACDFEVCLISALEAAEKALTEEITRVKVVDETGRAYVNMDAKNVTLNYQDDNHTLKILTD